MKDSDAQRIIEDYPSEVSRGLPARTAREAVPELRSHLIEEATVDGELTITSARRAVSRMGDPRSIAQEYLEEYKAEYGSEASEEKAAYPPRGHTRDNREFTDRWLRRRHYHHTHSYVSPSNLRWILLPGILAVAGTLATFVTDLLQTGQVPSPYIIFGGFTGLIFFSAIYYFVKIQAQETLKVVEGMLKTYEGQRVSIDDLSDDLGMRRRGVRAAITDLRASGRVEIYFDHMTGDIIVDEKPKGLTKAMTRTSCSYCGEALPSGSLFCPNCGASVPQQPIQLEGRQMTVYPTAGSREEPPIVRGRSRQIGHNSRVAIAILLITVVVLSGTLVTVGYLANGRPVDLQESHSVPQVTGVDTVGLVIIAQSAGINLNFAHLTNELASLNISVTGKIPLSDHRDPNNMSSFITRTFNYNVTSNIATVTARIGEVQPWDMGLNVTCSVLIDYSLNASVNIYTETGGIAVNTRSGVTLSNLNLTDVTGGIEVNLVEGVTLKGNTTISVATGGISFTWDNLNVNENIGLTLTTITGGIDATATQSTPLDGNITLGTACTTGGINYNLVIQGSIGATIQASATTGGIDIIRSMGFSGGSSLLQSNNYPAVSNFDIGLKTSTGGISINATRTP